MRNWFFAAAVAVGMLSPAAAEAQQYGVSAATKVGAANTGSFYPGRFDEDGSRMLVAGREVAASSQYSESRPYESTGGTLALGGQASASSNLATGQMKASASSFQNIATFNPAYAVAQGFAEMRELLTFNIAGASANTITTLRGIWEVHGIQSSGAFGSFYQNSSIAFQQQYTSNTHQFFYTSQTRSGPDPIGVSFGNGGFKNSSWSVSGDTMTFNFSYDMIGANPILDFYSHLSVSTSGNALSDFGNTSSLRFILPNTATFTSASGLFLSEVGAVPESSTWAMMIAGFGLLGGALRRQRLQIRLA